MMKMNLATTGTFLLWTALSLSSVNSFLAPFVVVPRRQHHLRELRPSFMVSTSTESKQAVIDGTTSSTEINGSQSSIQPMTTNGADSTTQNAVVESSSTSTKELTKTQQLMQQVKDAGTAGIISYALWELAFWLVSVPVVIFGYYGVVGHFPDLTDSDDLAKLGAEAFAFVNFARFAVPLRIGLALSTTPWIEANIVERYMKGNKNAEKPENGSE